MSEKTSVDDEPELEPMFEPDQSATPAAAKSTEKSGDDKLSQAQPGGSIWHRKGCKLCAPRLAIVDRTCPTIVRLVQVYWFLAYYRVCEN